MFLWPTENAQNYYVSLKVLLEQIVYLGPIVARAGWERDCQQVNVTEVNNPYHDTTVPIQNGPLNGF